MEERTLTEKESLELIARMIENTKQNLRLGGGNQFILWGALGAVVSLVVMVALLLTRNPLWNWLWFAIPVVGWPWMMWQLRKERRTVRTYTDKALEAVWRSVGSVGMAGLFLMSIYVRDMSLMLPGVILLMCVGALISGELLGSKLMCVMSGVSLGICIVAAARRLGDAWTTLWWIDYVAFAVSFVLMLVVPGWRMNREAGHV